MLLSSMVVVTLLVTPTHVYGHLVPLKPHKQRSRIHDKAMYILTASKVLKKQTYYANNQIVLEY